MLKYLTHKNLVVAISCFFILSAFVSKQSVNKEIFKQLYALEGRWIMKTSKGFIGEEWIKMNDEYLQNRGFVVKGADIIITERVALTIKKEEIFYTSTVEDQNNKKPISFKLTSGKNNIFIFENPQHDFPKRIVYELISTDSLHAYIDDGSNGTKKRRDFYYKKS
jgi:hypothetical protein